MANTTIQLKRSSVAGKQPNTSTLSIGELAINITDKKLYSSDGSNIFEPAANVTNLNVTGGIKANGSFGSNSQILTSNGSIVYWSTATSAPINTQDAHPSSPVDGQLYWNSILGKLLIYYDDGNTSQWVEAVNAATPTSNGAGDTGATAYSNAVSYVDIKIGTANTAMAANAAAAYSNAVSYVDAKIIDSVTNTSITHAASANSVKNAYDRAIDANTRAYSAQTEATSAYSNATSYADNKAANAYSNATSYADNKAANAYSNAVAYSNSLIIDSVTNTSITYVAAANSVKNAYDRAIDANTRAYSAQTEASNAYSNAVSYVDTANFTRTGITTFSANIVLGSSGLSSNGSFGTDGQVLTSNGTAVYWATTGGGGAEPFITYGQGIT